jgi:hypothetical protein
MNRLMLTTVLALALVPAAAHAGTYFGPRVGFSADPSQFVGGAQFTVTEVAPSLSLDPSFELGVGDDFTSFAVNFDLHYHFNISGSAWRPYAGGGATLFLADGDSFAGGGFMIGAGVPTRTGNRFFTEIKFGLGDVPDLKILAGWSFPQ